MDVTCQFQAPVALHPGKDPIPIGEEAGLDAVEYRKIVFPSGESNPGHPTRNPSLYRLSYPDSITAVGKVSLEVEAQNILI
jgi:hypothetical protein